MGGEIYWVRFVSVGETVPQVLKKEQIDLIQPVVALHLSVATKTNREEAKHAKKK